MWRDQKTKRPDKTPPKQTKELAAIESIDFDLLPKKSDK